MSVTFSASPSAIAAAHEPHQHRGDQVDAHVALVDDGVDEPRPRMAERGEQASTATRRERRGGWGRGVH